MDNFQEAGKCTGARASGTGLMGALSGIVQVCTTYPSAVVVPKSVDDDTIIAASNFREGGRFPVLSYRHDGGVSC
jgi:hypothetical protein